MRTRSIVARDETNSDRGFGGAYPSIRLDGGEYGREMSEGRGSVAPAAMVCGDRQPVGAPEAVLLFGFAAALAYCLPVSSVSASTFFQILPSLLTPVAVAGSVGRSRPPAADGRPHVEQ